MWREPLPGAERDRGQVFTLEGMFAGLVILLSVLLALQAVTVVPGSTSTSSGGSENVAQSALSAIDDETVRDAVLYWSSSDDGFHCADRTYYTGEIGDSCGDKPGNLPPNEFGAVLADQLGEGYQYNVVLRYGNEASINSTRMVYQGQPGNGAVQARTSVPLANDTELREMDGDKSGTSLKTAIGGPEELYAPPLGGSSEIYNVVHVEVVAWQS